METMAQTMSSNSWLQTGYNTNHCVMSHLATSLYTVYGYNWAKFELQSQLAQPATEAESLENSELSLKRLSLMLTEIQRAAYGKI